jgi:hypothetical protein
MRASPVVLFLVLSGCYRYQPLETPAPIPGTQVVANLTDAGSMALASQVGPGVASLRGAVVEWDHDGLLLALSSVMGRNDQETFWRGERVRVPHSTVASVQQRRFALGKTFLFGGTVVGGLLAAVTAFQGSGGGGVPGGGTGGQPE